MARATVTTAAKISVRLYTAVLPTMILVAPKTMPTNRPNGHTSLTPLRPSMMASMRKGTTRQSTAHTRAVIGATSVTLSPPVLAAMSTGRPTAPKATGTVLATKAVTAARSLPNPMATSMAAAMATGAPKPARASSRPPKQKAMRMPSTRGSSLMRKKVRRRSSNRLEITVTWYIQMALSRIHTMGNRP